MTKEINVIIAEDHPLSRLASRTALERSSEIKVTGEVETGFELIDELRVNNYDLILLDINLPQKSGIEILKQLKAWKTLPPVLIHSIYNEREYAMRAFNAGAKGYIMKDAEPDDLIAAVKRVAQGRTYMSDTVQEMLINKTENIAPHQKLSDREFEIMLYLAKDLPLKQIGNRMSISPKTVSTHRARILEKMNLKSNAEIALYVYKNRLDPAM